MPNRGTGRFMGQHAGSKAKVAGMMPDACLPALEACHANPGAYADWLADPSNVDLLEFAREMGYLDERPTP